MPHLDRRRADLDSAIQIREYTLRTLPLTPKDRRTIAEHITSLRMQLRLLEMRPELPDFLL